MWCAFKQTTSCQCTQSKELCMLKQHPVKDSQTCETYIDIKLQLRIHGWYSDRETLGAPRTFLHWHKRHFGVFSLSHSKQNHSDAATQLFLRQFTFYFRPFWNGLSEILAGTGGFPINFSKTFHFGQNRKSFLLLHLLTRTCKKKIFCLFVSFIRDSH